MSQSGNSFKFVSNGFKSVNRDRKNKFSNVVPEYKTERQQYQHLSKRPIIKPDGSSGSSNFTKLIHIFMRIISKFDPKVTNIYPDSKMIDDNDRLYECVYQLCLADIKAKELDVWSPRYVCFHMIKFIEQYIKDADSTTFIAGLSKNRSDIKYPGKWKDLGTVYCIERNIQKLVGVENLKRDSRIFKDDALPYSSSPYNKNRQVERIFDEDVLTCIRTFIEHREESRITSIDRIVLNALISVVSNTSQTKFMEMNRSELLEKIMKKTGDPALDDIGEQKDVSRDLFIYTSGLVRILRAILEASGDDLNLTNMSELKLSPKNTTGLSVRLAHVVKEMKKDIDDHPEYNHINEKLMRSLISATIARINKIPTYVKMYKIPKPVKLQDKWAKSVGSKSPPTVVIVSTATPTPPPTVERTKQYVYGSATVSWADMSDSSDDEPDYDDE